MTGSIEEVEPALAKAWLQLGVAAHMSTVNIVALCTEPKLFETARAAIEKVLPSHPGRAILAVLREGKEPRIVADASLACDQARHREACGEIIVLDVYDGARDWLPTVIERLVHPGSRVNLWWVGDLPDDYSLYDKLTETVDRVTVNSEEVDLRDLVTLAQRMCATRGRYALGDMNWVRLRVWQELLARFFDDPAVRPQLDHASVLTLATTDHRRGPIEEPASAQAILFAAWFAKRAGAHTKQARWTARTGPAHEITIPRRDGGTLTVRLVTEARDDVFPGALVRVALETDDGSHFKVERAHDNHRVLGWEGACAGAVIPQAVVRTDLNDNANMLARELERPVRDALFEASLEAAAELVTAPGA